MTLVAGEWLNLIEIDTSESYIAYINSGGTASHYEQEYGEWVVYTGELYHKYGNFLAWLWKEPIESLPLTMFTEAVR